MLMSMVILSGEVAHLHYRTFLNFTLMLWLVCIQTDECNIVLTMSDGHG